jgi:hypothetical protein
MADIESVHHHGSHRPLIWPADGSAPSAEVDAVIVPTARPVAYLKDAAAAALALGCPLVTLHSRKWTKAYDAAAHLDQAVDLIAIDVPQAARLRLPDLETSRLLGGTIFERRTDVSTKRNLALVLSNMLGWERVIFLDDDIRVPDPSDLTKAAGLLDTHIAVGLDVEGFPDNSMVCHAFRIAGGRQEQFIGGGALAVDVKRSRSYFPNVYNEDWFFVLDAGKRLQPVATVGQVLQYPYDPYRPERARAEEFGDVLAEGAFWLLDQGRPVSDGDLAHWRDFLAHRRQFIKQVHAMVQRKTSIDPKVRLRMGEALTAALGRCQRITPELCVEYMKALATDQDRWQRHIYNIRKQSQTSPEEALGALTVNGETPLTWYTRKTTSARKPGARKRRPFTASLPEWRLVSAEALRAAIPSPPPALVPRSFTAPSRESRQLPSAEAASAQAAHVLATARIARAGQQRHAASGGRGTSGPSQPVGL